MHISARGGHALMLLVIVVTLVTCTLRYIRGVNSYTGLSVGEVAGQGGWAGLGWAKGLNDLSPFTRAITTL